jgi:anti-sigma factor RsiW
MKMTDKNIEQIVEYVDGCASAEKTAQIEEMMRCDEALAVTVRRHSELKEMLTSLPVQSCGLELGDKVRARLHSRGRNFRRMNKLHRFAAGLILAACLGAVVSMVYFDGSPEEKTPVLAMVAEVQPVQFDTYRQTEAAPVKKAVIMAPRRERDVAMRSVVISVKVEDRATAEKRLTQALYNHSLLGSLTLTRNETSSGYHFPVSGSSLASLAREISPILTGNDNHITITDYSNACNFELDNIKGDQIVSVFTANKRGDTALALAAAQVENSIAAGLTPEELAITQPVLAATPCEPADNFGTVSVFIEISSQ